MPSLAGSSDREIKKEVKEMALEEIRKRIEEAARKLGLDYAKLTKEYGVTTALAEMLEQTVAEQRK